MKDRTQTVRLGIPAARKRSCTSEIEDRTKTESVDVWSFIEQVASLSWNLAWNQPVCGERVVKGLLSKLMAEPRYDELGVKLMDRATIRLQKGDPGWLNGIQIFLQMSDVEKFPLRYSLCWVSDPPPRVSHRTRVSRRVVTTSLCKIGIRAANLFRLPAWQQRRCKVNRYRRGEKISRKLSFERCATGFDKPAK